MFNANDNPYLVPYDGSFRVADWPTSPPSDSPGRRELKKSLRKTVQAISDQQRMLYAQDTHAVLLVFQAMDAAGKDSTIRAVTTGINPTGCQVFSFKKPSSRELDHDFLWRTACRLPERGRIGIFNRSYYEEVLVVRVHPGILDGQRLPWRADGAALWDQRLESIRDHEKHLARNGTVILKFWLNVSSDEQRRRFVSRIDEPHKNWKFSPGDVAERGHWDAYMDAYEAALAGTSRPWAPWYAIPADDKRYMRLTVATIVHEALSTLGLAYPEPDPDVRTTLEAMRAQLTNDDSTSGNG